MKHFSPQEFHGWFDVIHPELLEKLDEFRELLGSPVSISPADGAVGRRLGQSSRSYHNLDYHKYVKAIDVMPATDNLTRAFRMAKKVGFGGIGIYPHWKPRAGLHLDIRPKNRRTRWFSCVSPLTGKQEYFYL